MGPQVEVEATRQWHQEQAGQKPTMLQRIPGPAEEVPREIVHYGDETFAKGLGKFSSPARLGSRVLGYRFSISSRTQLRPGFQDLQGARSSLTDRHAHGHHHGSRQRPVPLVGD